MERGPMALFGAIVAVGLGPALWLGAQLGTDDVPVRKPSTTIRQQLPAAETDQGGYGAGEESEETTDPAPDWILPSSAKPVVISSPSPSASTPATPSVPASPSAEVSTEPVESESPATPSSEPSIEPSTEKSETPEPPVPPIGGGDESSAPALDSEPATVL